MGLSKGQKERRYGKNNTTAASTPHHSAPASRYPQGALYAEPAKASSNMYLVVAFVVAASLGAYNFFWVLPQFSHFAGNTVPELLFTFGRENVLVFSTNAGSDLLAQYASFHRSSALVFPILFALTLAGCIFTAKLPAGARNLHLSVPALFALVFIAGGFALDAALANPTSGAVPLASALITARWLLLLAVFAQYIYLSIRLVRSKVAAFARGKLPEQQG